VAAIPHVPLHFRSLPSKSHGPGATVVVGREATRLAGAAGAPP